MGSSPTLSACLIVKNEAHQLAEALTCLKPVADEIIVVDTGSSDNTKAVALSFTPLVFDFPWCDDFSAARNISLDHASGDYILWIDADDRINEENRAKIHRLRNAFDGRTGFYLILQDIDDSGPSYCLFQIRCVPRRGDVRFRGRIHERLVVDSLRLAQTDIVIEHHGYKDQALLQQKIRRNLAILEKELAEGQDEMQVCFYLALSYDHLGMGEEAAASMEKALLHLERDQGRDKGNGPPGISPFLPEAHLVLADVQNKLGRLEKARRHMVKALTFAGGNAHIYHRLAGLYQQMGDHARAVALYGKALEADQFVGLIPRKPLSRGKLRVEMAFSALCLQQEKMAKECLAEAWRLGIPLHESWEDLGHRAMEAQAFGSALQAYQEALRAGGLGADGLSNLGLLHSKTGHTQEALKCYQAAIEKAPGNLAALANLAHLRLKLGHLGTAGAIYKGLIAKGAKDQDILLGRALVLTREKDPIALSELILLIRKEWGHGTSDDLSNEAFLFGMGLSLESEGKPTLAAWARECAVFLTTIPR